MKNSGKIGSFSALALFLASLVLIVAALSVSRFPGDTSAAARRAERVLNSRMAKLESYARIAAEGDCSKWIDIEKLPEDMVIYRYCNDTLQSWVNQFTVSNDDIASRVYMPFLSTLNFAVESPLLQVEDTVRFVSMGPTWYLAKSIRNENCMVIAGLQVMRSEIRRSESQFNENLHLGNTYSIQTIDSSGGSEVVVEGRPQFKIVCESVDGVSPVNAGLLWAALLILLAAAFVYLRSDRSFRRLRVSIAVVLAALAAMYFWGRSVQNQFAIFSPSVYAGDDVLYSLGAVFLANLAFFIISLFVYVMRQQICDSLSARKYGPAAGISAAFVTVVAILVYAHMALRSIVRNSSISLELYDFADLEAFSVIVYLSFIVLLLSVPMICELIPLFRGKTWRYGMSSRISRIAFSIVAALYLVLTTSVLGSDKEAKRAGVWSNMLLLNRDIQFEIQLRMLENSIAEDQTIAMLSRLDNSTNAISRQIGDNYLSRISQQYSVSSYVYNDHNRTSASTAQYNSIINGGVPVADNSRFLYVENGGAYPYYAGVFLYFDETGTSFSRLVVKVEPRSSGENRGYGGIFGFTPPGKFTLPEGYSYGRYEGHDLKSYSGTYAYPTRLDEGRFLQIYQARSGSYRSDGYVHFSSVVSDDEAVIISRKQVGVLSYVIATVMVAIVAFLLLSLLCIGRRSEERRLGRGYYRTRIVVVLMASLTLTLVAMAVVSVVFVYSRNESNLRDMMSDRINVVSTMMNAGMRDVPSIDEADVQSTRMLMERIGSNTSSDITLYTTAGRVIMSTAPMVFDRQMMGGRIDGNAYDHIIYLHNRYYIQKESRGPRSFYCMYAPVLGSSGNTIAILSAPYTDERYDFESDAILHTLTIFSLFLVFLMVALVLVSRVVDRMFRPLSEMSEKMNTAGLESLEYIRYDRDDEISSLVQAYNRMVTELSESTRKLAQAERDKAWSSMARQVAHEIKNPLTPMKLKLQGVIRLKQKGDPAWQTRFDEASAVILNHIDILTETANEFSTFAKLYTEEPTSINLDKVLDEEIAMFDNKDNIHFDYYGLRDVVIEGPKPQLTRVFVNLINNSVQAIGEEEGGQILVSLRKSSDDAYYDIVFEDNGPGVSAENVEKLFTPNFTTKNGGSGLGLAISRSILERCGATISYSRSFSLGGACFTIKYPKQ